MASPQRPPSLSPTITGVQSSSNGKPPSQGETLAALYARNRDPELRERVVGEFRNLVEILASKMARKGAPAEDLVQVGSIGLLLALERYDPERGVKFTTYAVNTIVGEMKHYFRDCTWLVKVPRQLQEVASSVHRTNEKLLRRLGRSPTISELAEELNLSEELIVEAMELEVVYTPYSLDAHLGAEDTETHERLNEVLGRADLRLERLVEHAPLQQGIEELEPRKRWILRRRYFDECSQTQVGRELGISQMHVSRLEREALRELRELVERD
jgi:RNA polymerase sigma-B factor